MRTKKISRKNILNSYQNLIEKAKLDLDFILLTSLATAICFFGFRTNSASVIIGAMVISPLLYSIVSIGIASFMKKSKDTFQGISTSIIGIIVAIIVSTFLGLFFPVNINSEMISRLSSAPTDYFFIAFFSGLAGTFAFFWPDIIEAIAGIAISIALIPPVVLIGIGLATLDLQIATQSITIVAINIIGIYLGSLAMSTFLHFYSTNS